MIAKTLSVLYLFEFNAIFAISLRLCLSPFFNRQYDLTRMTYWKRRLLSALVLTIENFANSTVNQKQSNGECLIGVFYALLLYESCDLYSILCYIHIGVRLSHCSFRLTGQCEGLQSWSEQ